MTGCNLDREMQAEELETQAQEYERNGQFGQVVETWRKVIQMRPDNSSAKWLDHYPLGNLLMRLARYDEALKVFLAMQQYMHRASDHGVDPPELMTYLCIAAAYASLEKVDQSIDYLTQACGVTPRAMFIASQVDYFDRIRETPAYQNLHAVYFEAGKLEAERQGATSQP